MGRVDGKIVVVTGAGGGQGAAEARALAADGATVIATDVGVPELGEGIDCRVLDVTSQDDWRELAAHIEEEHGRLDGLVNNAGISLRMRILDLTVEALERVMRVNVGGQLLGIQTAVPLMKDGGSIVNVSSVAGLVGYHNVGYGISKWGVRALTRSASMELGPLGIRVNTVMPGYIETPMTAAAPEAFREANLVITPLGRVAQAEEVAPLIVYLIADESSFVTGAEIVIDGGQTAHGGAKFLSDAVRAADPDRP
ncbi:MAG TPA: SDR family oxidoreductase [Thermoleophilaceae bacterium]